MTLAVGVDLGGTQARAAVVDRASGRVVEAAKESWTDRRPEAVIGATVRLVQGLLSRHSQVEGALGVAFAGMLFGGRVVNAPNLGWRDVELAGPLQQALGRSVTVVNDLSAAAWGERSAGAARGAQHTLTVFVGTGVGSAIIAGGRLIIGARQAAAELGHVKVVETGGRRCGCGQVGCLEAYAGGAKLAEWMAEEGLIGAASDLEPLASKGDPRAKRLYDFATGQLALAIANQVTVLNPEVLVLGGGVLSRCPGMVQRIRDTVYARATQASVNGLRIEQATLGDDSGLVGAALLSLEEGSAR